MKIKTWYVRNKIGISLEKLACLTGISKSTLNNIENGRTSPTLEQLERIAAATNTRIQELYDSDYK